MILIRAVREFLSIATTSAITATSDRREAARRCTCAVNNI